MTAAALTSALYLGKTMDIPYMPIKDAVTGAAYIRMGGTALVSDPDVACDIMKELGASDSEVAWALQRATGRCDVDTEIVEAPDASDA